MCSRQHLDNSKATPKLPILRRFWHIKTTPPPRTPESGNFYLSSVTMTLYPNARSCDFACVSSDSVTVFVPVTK